MSDEVEALMTAWEAFVVPLRMREGIQDGPLADLRSALSDCAESWKGCDALPRRAVNVLVDIVPAVDGLAESYGEPLEPRLREIAYVLQALVWDCVALETESSSRRSATDTDTGTGTGTGTDTGRGTAS